MGEYAPRGSTKSLGRLCPHDALQLFLRRVGGAQYLILKPSIKLLDKVGHEAPRDVAGPIVQAILGYQHNKPFNQAVMKWRKLLLPASPETIYEFPLNSCSTFRFKIQRSPVFGEIGLPAGGQIVRLPDKLKPFVKYRGIELKEPDLLFANRSGSGTITSPHPVRGIAYNGPFHFP